MCCSYSLTIRKSCSFLQGILADLELLNLDPYPYLLLNPDQYRAPVAEFLVSDRGDKVDVDYGTRLSYTGPPAYVCRRKHTNIFII
jgi:hypothetical protein